MAGQPPPHQMYPSRNKVLLIKGFLTISFH